MKTKYEEYRICQERGHVSESTTSIGGHTFDTCKYCGTQYWTERSRREDHVPVSPTPESEGEETS